MDARPWTLVPSTFHKVLSTCRCEDEFEVNSGRTLTRLFVHVYRIISFKLTNLLRIVSPIVLCVL